MTLKTLSKISLFLSLTICFSDLFAQDISSSDKEFELALRNFVNENLVEFGSDVISQERFLVEQMRLINFEIQSRFKNLKEMRAEYFAGLQNRLIELRALKSRLSSSGSQNLMAFIDQLESRIEQTINDGRINYRRQKVFEDGLQLLYIAEEMGNLDTGTSVSGDPKIRQQLMSSQRQLSDTFGENGDFISRVNSASGATIFDLFREWKLTNTLEYEARWTDVQIIKNKLLRDGTGLDKQRMFRQELQSALLAFNFRRFDLAERMFEEIIGRYQFISTLDDIYYYRGEANVRLGRYEIARSVFLDLAKKYPTSSFTAGAYTQLIKIASHLDDHVNVIAYFNSYLKYATAMDPAYDENRLVASRSFISMERFEDAVKHLSQINSGTEFYIDGQYLLSQAYVGAENIDEAIRVLKSIISNYNLVPDYHFLIKMKLGYMMYEKGDYYQAISYFDEIKSDFSLYDRVLIGYGWAYYKLELQKPKEEVHDYSYAKKYVQIILDDYYSSDYVLEAKSLLGYILQLEEDADNAIRSFDDVYRARTTKEKSDQNLTERERLRANINQASEDRKIALAAYNRNDFIIAQSRYSTIQDSLLKLSYSDLSSSSGAAYSEIRKIQGQIAELERLKSVAARKNDPGMVEHIEKMQDEMRDVIADNMPLIADPRLGVNQFDEFPLARKESVRENNNQKVISMREDILGQREYIQAKLIEISAAAERARSRKNYKDLVELEIQKEKFLNLLKKFDQLNTYAYDLVLDESYADLQKWTDYGAFGMADVNYSVKQNKLQKRAYYIDQINKINQILNGRKELLEYKIGLVDGEIGYMTRKVRQQERMRERAELDRKFEESYFDTHTSEVPESEEAPQIIEDQEN